MSRSSKSSPGSPPGKVPYLTPLPTPQDDTKPASWDEEKLRGLFSTLSKEEILQAWNGGLALASVSLAVQAGLVTLPEPQDRPPEKKG